MVMALSGTFYDFGRVAERHVARGRPRVAFVRTVLGHLMDGFSAYWLNKLNRSLERDVVRMRGLRASVLAIDSLEDELDPSQQCIGWLQMLENKVLALQGDALKAKTEHHPRMKKSYVAVCRTAELAGELHESLVELRIAIAEHDAEVQTAVGKVSGPYDAQDLERMLADLKK
jgi:hypothetical protein